MTVASIQGQRHFARRLDKTRVSTLTDGDGWREQIVRGTDQDHGTEARSWGVSAVCLLSGTHTHTHTHTHSLTHSHTCPDGEVNVWQRSAEPRLLDGLRQMVLDHFPRLWKSRNGKKANWQTFIFYC